MRRPLACRPDKIKKENPMNRKTLSVLVALSLSAASVQAQDYPTNWYVAPYLGVSFNDNERYVDDDESVLAGVGVGRLIAPNSSLEFSADYNSRDFGSQFNYTGSSSSLAVTANLRHFLTDNTWRPYVLAGLGMSYHRADNQLGPGSVNGWDPVAQFGVGVQRAISDDMAFRTELAYRADYDNRTVPGESEFGDILLTAGVLFGVGSSDAPSEPTAIDPADVPAEPAPTDSVPPVEPGPTDGDGDGVLDADDKCPDSKPGEVVGPDGCPQSVVIDLRGVNFAFDKSELTPESIAILDQAVDVLNRYPAMKVEVAGHTDAIGTDAYNQGLSERRAKVVYAYLTDKGIDASRLSGPNGYGEGRPIDSNDNADGRARNRRTELVKQQ
jgi:OmpA-OmpF porin, OOP family